MFRLVKKHPATLLFLLATALGAAPLALVAAALLPASFNQLGALSASAAGITLAAIDGGKKSVRDLLGRVLIWRVNAGWWLFVLLFPAVLTVGSLYGMNPCYETKNWAHLQIFIQPSLHLVAGEGGWGRG